MRSNHQRIPPLVGSCTQTPQSVTIAMVALIGLLLSSAATPLLAQSNPTNPIATPSVSDNNAETAPPNDAADTEDDTVLPRVTEPPLEVDQRAEADTYQSSESISEDSSVSFPVDI